MRTTPTLKNKPSSEELKVNDSLTIDFIMAVMTKDLPALEKLLYQEYRYLNNLSKWETLKWFKDQFSRSIPEEYINNEIKENVCTGCKCGNRSLMFHHGYFPMISGLENSQKTLTLDFEDGKIKDITICYSFISIEQTNERSGQN